MHMLHIGLILIILISINSHNYTVHRHKRNNITYLTPSLRQQMANTNHLNSIGLGNQNNFQYYITMSIGTPPQQLNLQLDTGSNIMWVALSTVGIAQYFNGSQSSSFNNTNQQGSILYVDGGVYGTYGTQIIGVSNTSIINLTQTILWAYQVDNLFIPLQIAGLVGMGYTTIPNFLDLAYLQGQIATSAFTLSLRSTFNNQSSYLYYNQIPEFITRNSVYLPVVEGGYYWQIQTIGIIVGGIVMSSFAADVSVFDSGTSYFYLNTDLFNQVENQFFSNCVAGQYGPLCFCSETSTWPTFNFLLNGIGVFIHPAQYTGIINDTYCTYNFGSIGIYEILLGDIFFFAYNVSYSKLTSEIGFAGQINYIDVIIPIGTNIVQYVLLAIIVCICVIGIVQLFFLNYLTYEQQVTQGRESDMQISNLNKTNLKEPLYRRDLFVK